MRSVMTSWVVAVLSVAAAGCSASAPSRESGTEASSLATAPSTPYFRLRPDLRRCASPLCGGYFVSLVNRETTRCADGSLSEECYVAEIDLSGLGLTPEQESELRAESEEFLVRGRLGSRPYPPVGDLGILRASEAWRGHEGVVPSGVYYRAWNNGLVCITQPCLSISATRLNSQQPARGFAGLDLSDVSADPSDGYRQLDEPEGLLVAAQRSVVIGPAGTAPGLDASEYWLPFPAGEVLCGSRGLPECGPGEFCDFSLEAACGAADAPGACRPLPSFCPDIYDPVCGCDGQTYGNDCEANAAGVSVASIGPCELEPCAGIRCAAGTHCEVGQCVPDLPFCGGIAGIPCEEGLACVDDPRDDCDPNQGGADCSGICVGEFCGGIAGIPCEEGLACVDDPRDDCDPNQGGADCSGVCVPGGSETCAADPCADKACGESCRLCCPDDPDCVETAVEKFCQADGTCSPTEPVCLTDPCAAVLCPEGSMCVVVETYPPRAECVPVDPCAGVRCAAGTQCEAGQCVPDFPFCGGIAGIPCEDGLACVDDPRDDCDPKQGGADCSGICVGEFCGGIAGIPCEDGLACVDDPRDDCDPNQGGADCSGVCVPAQDDA